MKYDTGSAVDSSRPDEGQQFRRFVGAGEGPIQSKVLSRFLHSLNNLLTVANGYVSLLEPCPSGDASLRELHREALHAGERAAAVSQALQSLMLGQLASEELHPVFVDDMIRSLEPLLSAVTGRQVPIHLDLSSRVGPILVNPPLLLRAITACLADALPDRSSSSICFTVCREQNTDSPQAPWALLRIVSMAPPGEPPGAIGFAVSQLNELLATWDGSARNVQTPGTHWDLRILLPACDEQNTPLCNGPRASAGTRPCWRVLVVEEDPAQLRILESGLLDAGLAVASFTRGSVALESIRQDPHHYNLVISDILGSDLTGLELARALRLESPCTHVVFSTSAERLALAKSSTNAPLLSRPFDMAQVLDTVDSLCGTARPTILVADDEESVRLLVRQCLAEEGYVVLEADDGLHACEVLQEREVQLLIVDLVMPAHEGLETIRSICRRGHRLKILAISGQRPEYLKAAGLLGADAVLRKPFSPVELRAAVERLLKQEETSSV